MNFDTLIQAAIAVLTAGGSAWGVVRWVVGRLDAEQQKREDAIAAERRERANDRQALMDSAQKDREMFFKAVREDSAAREAMAREFEKARADDRHAARDELTPWVRELQVFQQQVIRDHPTYDRLAEIIKPLTGALEDLRQSVDKVFEKLDGKADKNTRPVGH